MHSFKQKHLEVGLTLGEQLSQARVAKKINLKQAADFLSIQEKYLNYLEQSDNEKLPGDAYAKNWIKRYCDLLDLDGDNCIDLYFQEKKLKQNIGKPIIESRKKIRLRELIRRLSSPKTLRLTGILIIALILLGYLSWFMFKTFEAPQVVFDQQLRDQKTTSTSLLLSGHTDIGTQMWFNDKIIMVDDHGLFRQDIPLSAGLNIITIRAKKKHSQSYEQTIQVVRTASETAVATSTAPY